MNLSDNLVNISRPETEEPADPSGASAEQVPASAESASEPGLESAPRLVQRSAAKKSAKKSAELPPRAGRTGMMTGPPTPEVLESAPPEVQAKASKSLDKEDSDESTNSSPTDSSKLRKDTDPYEFFKDSISRPNNSDIADMLRWQQKQLNEAEIQEHYMEWTEKIRPLINKVDQVAGSRDPLTIKRTFILLVAADYFHRPKEQVFQLEYTITRAGWHRWMKDPQLAALYDQMYRIMEEEVIDHEIKSIRHATRVTRMSAGRAAEVRRDMLENKNPWVALQAARDIMQSASADTADKGNTSVSIKASLSEEQVQRLLDRATTELRGWQDISPTHHDERPIVIIEQDKDTAVDIEDAINRHDQQE